MPWTGSGVVQRTDGTRAGPTTWQDARDQVENILAEDHDAHDQDLAEAIERCLNIDGENALAADIDADGNKLTGLADGSASGDSASLGQIQRGAFLWAGTTGGTSAAQTCSISPAPASIEAGQIIRLIAGVTKTGGVTLTLNVNGMGSNHVKTMGGADIAEGDWDEGSFQELVYDGTHWRRTSPLARPRRQVIQSSTTWNKPDGLLWARIIVVGGGGGSGGIETTAGGENAASAGGGGGEYAEGIFAASALGSTESVTVGAAGAAGSAGDNDGGAGGTSSFGAHITAVGGSGGAGGAASSGGTTIAVGGAGGTGGSGPSAALGGIRLAGGRGGNGVVLGGSRQFSASGGASHLSNGQGVSPAPNAGLIYGGGATGVSRPSGTSEEAGAVGGIGVVIVEGHY